MRSVIHWIIELPDGQDPPLRPVQNPQQAHSEQERLLLLKNLFAAKQRALRRYQFYNREYAEMTSDRRDACYAPSDDFLARVGPWPRMAMPQAKMKDQSRQVIETKGSAPENKAVKWGPEITSPSRSSRA